MPTILQILPTLNTGGVERGTIEISKAIIANKYNSIVISAGGKLVPLLEKHGAIHITLNVNSKNPFIIYRNSYKLKKIFNDYNVDIVHARSRAPAWSAYLATKNSKIKFITTFHGIYSGKNFFKKCYNAIMTKGVKVIAVSNFIKNHILDHYHISDPSKIICIHRGVDITQFNEKNTLIDQVQKYINNYHIPDDKKIILMPARITAWKGHEFLINSLKKLSNKDYHCLIVGDAQKHPNYRNRLEKLILSLKLQDNITIMNNIPDIENLYKIASIIISASIRPEPFGRNIVEAGAMGKIVIATKHGGATESIIDGETGFLVELNNTNDFAKKIDHVLNLTTKQKNNIEQNAKNHVINNFSITQMQNKTIDLYNSLITHN